MSMARFAATRGYVLEETIAWLLRHSGYRLLTSPDDDRDELDWAGHGLLVRGRGADHQADVLAEFTFVPPFSLPVRLFVEAKYRKGPCGLEILRNAHGLVRDVNENFVRQPTAGRPRRRYQYLYSLFSTSGFTAEAQEYAVAHQISLVDLSGNAFEWLRVAAHHAAQQVAGLEADVQAATNVTTGLPRAQLRAALRRALGTAESPALEVGDRWRIAEWDVARVAQELQRDLSTYGETEVVLGFPPAPFVLTMTGTRPHTAERFYNYAESHPRHTVGLRRHHRTTRASHWELFPRADSDAYRLFFGLPGHVEQWITSGDQVGARARAIKVGLLPSILVYRVTNISTQVYQLDYSTVDLGASS